MPRKARTWVPGAGAHTICRFIDRRFYLVDDLDRRMLLDAIGRANDRWDWQWLSYAVMSTHMHYGHLAGINAPDRFFRSAHTRFAQRYHHRRDGRTLGHVLANRPAVTPIHASGLARLVAYHHRNPVSAGLVDRPSQSTWTSHRAYLRLDPAPRWLDVEHALHILGFDDTEAGRRRFDDFVMEVDLEASPAGAIAEHVRVSSLCRALGDGEWRRVVKVAREVTGLASTVSLSSKRRGMTTRLLVAFVATRDLDQTCSTVAEKLRMNTGSVTKLLSRNADNPGLASLLVEFRQRFTTAAE
ncbi:MAG: hypothetical protein GXP55_13865 [Deltaproteobacteria bacterium]|nr:hypothetical protein [Deltaproteobacteria bacterium]